MISKKTILKIADWTYGCQFIKYCPVLKSKVEFETYLGHEHEITPRVVKTLNEFLSISENTFSELERVIINTYNSVKFNDGSTKLEQIINDCGIEKSTFLNHFITQDWIQIELLWDNIEKFKNNYVNIGFYYPTNSYATYLVFENGILKTSFIHNGEDEYPSEIFK